nr:radical SAM protein [Couchioplanes caeruleus]
MEMVCVPSDVIWDITYACPLRCIHCYSESGRRPTRQLGAPDLLRVADALIAMRPSDIAIAGGEPLVVPDLFAVAERFSRSGISVTL